MKYQRGVSLSGLLMSSVVFALVALVAMKVAPAWIEYGKILKVVKATAADTSLRDAAVTGVQAAYVKRAGIEDITSITPDDLEITKEDNRLVIAFSYATKVPLFANVSLVFDFEGSSEK
jgi:hypothetical protein